LWQSTGGRWISKNLKSRKLGIGFSGSPYGASEIAKISKLAEDYGFTSMWIAEDYFLRDSVTLLTSAALATSKINLALGVVNPFTRHPVLIAQTAASLSELSKGRFILAMGTGEKTLIESMGISFNHPLTTMRESVEIIRGLLSGKRVRLNGNVFSINDVRLGENPYISYPDDDFGHNSSYSSVEIFLAAIGPKMLALARVVGDGVLLTAGITEKKVEEAKLLLYGIGSSGSKKTKTARFHIAGYIVTCLGAPTKSIKRLVADTARFWPENLIASGVQEDKVRRVGDVLAKKGMAAAIDLVTEDMIRAIVALGSAKDIEAKVEEYRRAGMDLPILLPMGSTNASRVIEDVGKHVS
jgi:5,10-methylenetetrahydromethanopterin reductase